MTTRARCPTKMTTSNSLGRNTSPLKLINGHLPSELDFKYDLKQWFSSCTPRASSANNESFKLHLNTVYCFVLSLYFGISQYFL